MAQFQWNMRIKEDRCKGLFYAVCTHKTTKQVVESGPVMSLEDARQELIYFYKHKRFKGYLDESLSV